MTVSPIIQFIPHKGPKNHLITLLLISLNIIHYNFLVRSVFCLHFNTLTVLLCTVTKESNHGIPTEAWIASLLNLSNEDKAAHAEIINDFFARDRLSEDTESEESVKGSLKLDLDLDSIFYNNKQNIITQNRILFCSSVLRLLGLNLDLCNKMLFSCY